MGYVTAARLAQHLGFTIGADSDPTSVALEEAVAAASAAIDDHCGRSFAVAGSSATRTFCGEEETALIDDAATVTLVEHSLDAQTWTTVASSAYVTKPFNHASYGLPITALHRADGGEWLEYVRVTGTWGWSAVPAQVVSATLLKAARIYKRKDSPNGIEGAADFGVVRVNRAEDGDVVILLEQLVRADRVLGFA